MDYINGNHPWESHSKHGRDHLFKTPEALWEAACGYFQWCDEHPIYVMVKGIASQPYFSMPKLRAYTLRGLCIHLGCGSPYFSQFEAQLAGKTDEVSEEFKRIIALIHDVIYEQKFTAAAAGELNPSLIARELNLNYNASAAIHANTDTEPKKPRSVIVWGEHEIPI